MSDADQHLADEAHRHGVPTFLLRLRRDGVAADGTAWHPSPRRD